MSTLYPYTKLHALLFNYSAVFTFTYRWQRQQTCRKSFPPPRFSVAMKSEDLSEKSTFIAFTQFTYRS